MAAFIRRVKSALWIFLIIVLLMKAPSLWSAQEQAAEGFPNTADSWGESPRQVTAAESLPLKNTLDSPALSVYACPITLFESQGEGAYYFAQQGLYSVLFTFQPPQKNQSRKLFRQLESALNCFFKTSGSGLEVSKDGVEVRQVFWEDRHTFAYLSYFSTFPELTVKMMAKQDAGNQLEIELFQKWRRKHAVPPAKAG